MKKHLLLGALMLGSFLTANAQESCANAINIATDGTSNSGAITGAYGNNCWGGTNNQQNPTAPLAANWYTYTPAANGVLTISSDLASNPATADTRLSVFTGTCAALVCYNLSDDVSGTNLKTNLTIPVASGVTYYIAWDNNWSSAAFDFSVEFTAADCVPINTLAVNGFTDITTSSANLSWDAAVGNPANYDVEVGAIGFTPGSGTAEVFSTDTNSVSMTGLSTTNNDYLQAYIRSDCGGSQSGWVGPYNLFLAVMSSPYANGFDVAAGGRLAGFTAANGWNALTNAQAGGNVSQAGDGFVFSNTLETGAADAWLFTRSLSLGAGQEVTITFFTRVVGPAGNAGGTLNVTVGANPVAADQTTILGTFNVTEATYVERTVTFTPTDAGIYNFAVHNNSPMAAANLGTSLLADSFTVTGAVANVVEANASQFSVYPNPATNVINVANDNNSLLNSVEIVDLNGRTVKSSKFDGATEAQINISDLASGVYIMNIASDKGTATKKIVKN